MQEPRNSQPELVRAIGRWSMVALAVNCILGSGIFGLPSVIAALLGTISPLAVLAAGAGMAVIVACYAELAVQFPISGGTYLYVRRAFGRLVGLQVGWMTLLTRATACAASVNLLVSYLSELWPGASAPLARASVLTLFLGLLAVINYRGVSAGTLMSNAAVVGKLAALAVVGVAGLLWLARHGAVTPAPVSPGAAAWLKALLLLLFAYGGYETALNPMGEARNPRRDVVFALFAALAVVAVFYSVLQLIVIRVLPDAAHSERPLADTAARLLGAPGAVLVSLGALVSVYGFISANLLAVPRSLLAMAQGGDFPRLFARIHPRYRTPSVAIVTFAVLVWLFAQLADFSWNVTLSALARLFYYAATCAAVPVLRRRGGEAGWRVPGGLLLPAVGIALCMLLLAGVDFSKSLIMLATVAIALGNWLAVRARAPTPL